MMEVSDKLPPELLRIIETYTRRPQSKELLDDVKNCVHHLDQLEKKNQEIRKIYMVVDEEAFTEIEVKRYNNYYRSIENYIRYACELYPYYSEYETILRRCYYGGSQCGIPNQYHKWRNGYENTMKYMYVFEEESSACISTKTKTKTKTKTLTISRDEKSKRLCRMLVSLCKKEERDKLFCNLNT